MQLEITPLPMLLCKSSKLVSTSYLKVCTGLKELFVCLVLLCAQLHAQQSMQIRQKIPSPLYGITLDAVSKSSINKIIDAIKADKVQRSGSRDPNLNLERRSAYHNPVAFERQAGNIPCGYLAGCVV